ncbi:MAG: hypothetical protein ACOYL5_05630 [Phototrophicaceae bacterium]
MSSFMPPLLLALCLGVLSACQGATPPFPPTPTPFTEGTAALPAQLYSTTLEGHSIQVEAPSGWALFSTPEGVILAENIGALKTANHLQGILVYIFFPHLDYSIPVNAGNPALALLNAVVQDPNYIGQATTSAPSEWMWGDYPCAYYTLNGGDGSVTMLLAVALDRTTYVAYNISLPAQEHQRLRAQLPHILQSVQIGDHHFLGEGLNTLPDPLAFPAAS